MRVSVLLCLLVAFLPVAWAVEPKAGPILAVLVDPVRIDGLKGERAANPRLRKMVYWLEVAKRRGEDPEKVLLEAQRAAGYGGTVRAVADRDALLRNRTILERLGCLDEEGMMRLRKGLAPVVRRGPYAGEIAAVDHIIPRAVAPELDEKIYNLEFMPATLNRRKGALIGVRQRQLAERWVELGLMSEEAGRRVRAGK